MQSIPVRLLGWKDSLEKGTTTHSSILAWRQEGTLRNDGSILYLSWGASYPATQCVKIQSTCLTSIPFTVCKF